LPRELPTCLVGNWHNHDAKFLLEERPGELEDLFLEIDTEVVRVIKNQTGKLLSARNQIPQEPQDVIQRLLGADVFNVPTKFNFELLFILLVKVLHASGGPPLILREEHVPDDLIPGWSTTTKRVLCFLEKSAAQPFDYRLLIAIAVGQVDGYGNTNISQIWRKFEVKKTLDERGLARPLVPTIKMN
jgi:hypothetical protein